ncbi:MAG: right-handed parallel beta-helix repeat-containing protein [Nitrospirota bacterium]
MLVDGVSVGAVSTYTFSKVTASHTISASFSQVPVTSTGNSYYIATTGSDSNSGTITSPWLTLAHGAAALHVGDTLYVRGGTYTGQGSSNGISMASGTASAPITIMAYPGETPVFDGTSVSAGCFLTFENVSYVVLSGVTIQNYSVDGIIFYTDAKNITVQNCILEHIGTNVSQDQGIYIMANTANITIRNNLIQYVASCGIQGWHGPNVNGLLIYNNVITNCSFGILLGDEGQNIGIYNNTIDSNQYGLDFSQAGQDDPVGVVNLTMKNNIISNCSQWGMRVGSFDYTQIKSDYNCWYGNANDIQWNGSNYSLAQCKANTTNDAHSIGTNPSFVNAAARNYQLNSGSPCVDAGTPQTLFNTNMAGIVRSAWDIGAY